MNLIKIKTDFEELEDVVLFCSVNGIKILCCVQKQTVLGTICFVYIECDNEDRKKINDQFSIVNIIKL